MATNPVIPEPRAPRQRSVSELMGDLTEQMTVLVHDEIELAKAELQEKGRRLGMGAGMFGAAAACGFLAAATAVACVVAALSGVMPVWAAALIVAVGLMAMAGLFAISGRRQAARGMPPVPEQAIDSTREDAVWLKSQIRSARP